MRLILALAFTGMAFASTSFTLTLDDPAPLAVAGQTVTFTGTITNLTAANLYLNDAEVSGLTMDFTSDTSPLLINSDYPMTANEIQSGIELFTVTVPTSAMIQTYTGTFTVLGGPDSSDQTILDSEGFSVVVTPEPSTMALMGAGLAALAAFRRRVCNTPR